MNHDHSDRELDALLSQADRSVLGAVTDGLDIAIGLTHFSAPAARTSQTPQTPQTRQTPQTSRTSRTPSVPQKPSASEEPVLQPPPKDDPPLAPSTRLADILHTTRDVLLTVGRLQAESGAAPPGDIIPGVRRALASHLDEIHRCLTTLEYGLDLRRLSKAESGDLIATAADRFGKIGMDLVGVATATDEEALYWQAVEWIDMADEAQDRLREVARVIPRLFDDIDDAVMNPVFLL
ncbi:hypothetical protein GPA10_37785 [Streptomyces sp. p1417]|uniref:Uncharacterized protein n=1 Tax=Streptomyces typhae TaxID=2681492 RepID=A0A6L6XA64_9ACTN|nr:hypothetical protein [Streptomyces typhae]